MLTAGADNGVLAFLLRQAKIVFAGRTLFIYVGFSVTHFAFLQIVKFGGFINQLNKFQVLLLSFINVSGQNAEGRICENHQFHKRNNK